MATIEQLRDEILELREKNLPFETKRTKLLDELDANQLLPESHVATFQFLNESIGFNSNIIVAKENQILAILAKEKRILADKQHRLERGEKTASSITICLYHCIDHRHLKLVGFRTYLRQVWSQFFGPFSQHLEAGYYTLSFPTTLQRHSRTHTTERTFSCPSSRVLSPFRTDSSRNSLNSDSDCGLEMNARKNKIRSPTQVLQDNSSMRHRLQRTALQDLINLPQSPQDNYKAE